MVFNSLEYAVFLPAVLVLYWRLGHRGQNRLLLVASYLFYAAFDWRFLGLMWLSTITDYVVGLALSRSQDDRARRQILVISLAVNLGVLGFFKYFGFFVESADDLLRALGIEGSLPVLRILLPIGISFYTFHGISYTVDIYRRQIEPARDLLAFAVFVAYFPQLVAGPIGRAHLQLPQFERERTSPSRDEVGSGLFLIAIGLVKKVALADSLAPFVNSAHDGSEAAGWVTLLIGMFGFALQIYGDFSGYSDIARGSSRLFGIELPVNFRQPYFARNITEFWHRWHISLSTWLRDYLYISLGGNRGTPARTYRNLMITMVLGGLWHGADFTFLVWGAGHGALLAFHRWLTRDRTQTVRLPAPIAIAGTATVVSLLFVVFRAESLTDATHYLSGLASLRPGPVDLDAVLVLLIAAAGIVLLDVAQGGDRLKPAFVRLHPLGAGVVGGLMLAMVLITSGGTPVPFIYFQF